MDRNSLLDGVITLGEVVHMRPKGSAAVLEARRRRAIQMLADERSLNEIARRIGCNASSVMPDRKGSTALV